MSCKDYLTTINHLLRVKLSETTITSPVLCTSLVGQNTAMSLDIALIEYMIAATQRIALQMDQD